MDSAEVCLMLTSNRQNTNPSGSLSVRNESSWFNAVAVGIIKCRTSYQRAAGQSGAFRVIPGAARQFSNPPTAGRGTEWPLQKISTSCIMMNIQ